jgi:hypothetical protein
MLEMTHSFALFITDKVADMKRTRLEVDEFLPEDFRGRSTEGRSS